MITYKFLHHSYYFSFFYKVGIVAIVTTLFLQQGAIINNAQAQNAKLTISEQFSDYLLAQNESDAKDYLTEAAATTSLQTMQMQYTAGFRNTGFLKSFAQKLKDNNLSYDYVVKSFLDIKRKRNECKNTETIDFVYNFAGSVHTQAIDELIQRQVMYEKIYGEQAVQNKIKSAVMQGIQTAINATDTQLLQRCLYICNNADLNDLHSEFALNMHLKYYEATQNNTEYVRIIQNFWESYTGSNPELCSRLAWELCNKSKNLHCLYTAEKAILKALNVSMQEYSYHEIYANILLKMHRFEEAKMVAKCGIAIAKSTDSDYNYLQKLVNIIETTQQKSYNKKNIEI